MNNSSLFMFFSQPAICVIKTDSEPKRFKKTQQNGYIARRDFFVTFTYCFRISICDDASRFNGDACKGKASLHELKQLKHSASTKNAAANKISTKCKKQCQMLRSLRKKKKNSGKLQVLSINYPNFAHFSNFLLSN